MNERLALTAASMAELQGKLERFAAGRTDIEALYRGAVKRSKEEIAVVAQDDDHRRMVGSWMAKGKYAALLALWVKGLPLDWRQLHGEVVPCRISLPTYPFARERHWQRDTNSGAAPSRGTGAVLHPLLHSNTSDFDQQRFSSHFSGLEPFFADHVVHGVPVLPGVACLEMAREAVAQSIAKPLAGPAPGHVAALKNIVWLQPVVAAGNPVTVHIAVFPERTGDFGFEVYSQGEGVHVQGQAALVAEVAEVATIDLAAARAQCTRPFPAAQCYEAFEKAGIAYGPAHRGIEAAYAGVDAGGRPLAVARIRLPAAAAGASGYVLHPSLMDAALQGAIALALAEDPADAACATALPFALETLQILASCPQQLWAIVRYCDGEDSGHSRKLDIDLCDDQGLVCVRFKGLALRGARTRAADGDFRTLLTAPAWCPEPHPPEPGPIAQHWVILALSGQQAQQCAASIEDSLRPARCLVLDTGAGGLDIAARYGEAAIRLLAAIKELLATRPRQQVLIQLVISSTGQERLWAGLYGLLRTARKENDQLVTQLLEVDPQAASDLARKLQDNAGAGPVHVRYRGAGREVAGWQELTGPAPAPPWKDGGVYLITGGAGGLGLLFAREIAQRVSRPTLVLAGRSQLDAGRKAHLRALEALGARVEYRAANVGRTDASADLIEGIVQRHGKLDGILHAAGVIHDSYLANKTDEELQAVFEPKVNGAVNLDEASKELPLDCFVLISSVSGALGNAGQGDYAAANAFMDAFSGWRDQEVAAGRRHGRTLSVNWPLWVEGGMSLDATSEKRLWQTSGQQSLPTADGMRSLYAALTSDHANVMAAHGDVQRLRQKLLGAAPPQLAGDAPTAAPMAKESLQSQAEQMLAQQVSDLLKVDAKEIDAGVELGEYGFDSIGFTQFANALNDALGLELAPTLFFEYSTLATLARYLVKAHEGAVAAKFSAQDVPASAPGRLPRARFTQGVAAAPSPEPVAIIGIGGCFPMAGDPDGLWRNLVAGRNCITEVPPDRWDWRAIRADAGATGALVPGKWGGFVEGVGDFDAAFFAISPREAELMDPQQRLLMTYVWKAIEDAGYAAEQLSGTRTALFAGTGSSGYSAAAPHADGYSATGAVPSVGPNRMSYFLNLHGPSEPVETACSSSLVAVHRALLALDRDGCELAIAGGVNTVVSPRAHVSFSQSGMLSEDGCCKTFSQHADGYVRGEGAGFLVLKKLAAAERDGDHIYGVIRASAENHGGRANSLTAPNHRAQEALLVDAYSKAGVDPPRWAT
ncbi:MAG: SDR family NAD(P)-dependent oxidoreductase [Ramlibacter sp.]|nr:SDR family NAD(P)-dependent oxidoreductase [Ramlibacter sp.]